MRIHTYLCDTARATGLCGRPRARRAPASAAECTVLL